MKKFYNICKKLFNNSIFMFFLGAFLFGGIACAVASELITIQQVGYVKSDGSWASVDEAIEELYTKERSHRSGVVVKEGYLIDQYLSAGYGSNLTMSVIGVKKIKIEFWCNQGTYHKLSYTINGEEKLTDILPAYTHNVLYLDVTDDTQPFILQSWVSASTSVTGIYFILTIE